MNVLLSGHESLKRVNLLLSLTRITSLQQIKAITIHLVNGMEKNQAAMIYGVDSANLNRALKSINDVALIVEKIKDIDFNNCQLTD